MLCSTKFSDDTQYFSMQPEKIASNAHRIIHVFHCDDLAKKTSSKDG